MRRHIASGSPFEAKIGFARAVRVGDLVFVSGTAPLTPEGDTAHHGDVYQQTRRCLEIIGETIAKAGLDLRSIARTRIMLVDIETWEDAARAHAEVFADIAPACTIVEVSRFIDPDWLVEVEADCVSELGGDD